MATLPGTGGSCLPLGLPPHAPAHEPQTTQGKNDAASLRTSANLGTRVRETQFIGRRPSRCVISAAGQSFCFLNFQLWVPAVPSKDQNHPWGELLDPVSALPASGQ